MCIIIVVVDCWFFHLIVCHYYYSYFCFGSILYCCCCYYFLLLLLPPPVVIIFYLHNRCPSVSDYSTAANDEQVQQTHNDSRNSSKRKKGNFLPIFSVRASFLAKAQLYLPQELVWPFSYEWKSHYIFFCAIANVWQLTAFHIHGKGVEQYVLEICEQLRPESPTTHPKFKTSINKRFEAFVGWQC